VAQCFMLSDGHDRGSPITHHGHPQLHRDSGRVVSRSKFLQRLVHAPIVLYGSQTLLMCWIGTPNPFHAPCPAVGLLEVSWGPA